MTATVRPSAPTGEVASDRYRPFLDGLRAVAVYLVVAFHAGSDRLAGGFIGVDVFFVLSGYLVTQLLVRDVVGADLAALRRFYARRVRRLLPAAVVVLVLTATVFSAIASPVEVADAEGGFRASFLYIANWHFIGEASAYFGADVETNPVLHFWSLAVEEQFYVVWPLLLGGLFLVARRAGARQTAVVRTLVLVGAAGSALWAWSLRDVDPNRAYYGTDARAYQLLAGATLALSPGAVRWLAPRAARGLGGATAVGLAALVALASSGVTLDAIERGMAATILTVGLILGLEAGSGGGGGRVLSAAPVVYLGRISYGTYLWHWPVIVILTRSVDVSVLATLLLTTLVATALASLSYELLEQPIRRSPRLDRHRGPVIAVGLTVSVVSALVVIPAIVDRGQGTVAPAAAPAGAVSGREVGLTPVPPDLDLAAAKADFARRHDCVGQPASACTVREGPGPHLLLLGDSHAQMLIPTFTRIADERDLRLSVSTQFVCPWQDGLHAVTLQAPEERLEECRRAQTDLYERVVPALDPDVIVVVNRGYEQPAQEIQYRGPDEQPLTAGAAGFDAWLEEVTTRSVRALEAGGAAVVVVEPIPYGALDPLRCLSEATVVEACRQAVSVAPSPVERLYRRLDRADDRLWSLDLDALVCPYLPVCDPIVGGQVVRTDSTHLTQTYAQGLSGPVEAYLTDNGVLPRG